jgi:hypothetical protein
MQLWLDKHQHLMRPKQECAKSANTQQQQQQQQQGRPLTPNFHDTSGRHSF